LDAASLRSRCPPNATSVHRAWCYWL
jgi:hypothetical protein